MSLNPFSKPYTLYGWDVSPYTAKVKAFLDYKGIEYQYSVPNIWTLKRRIQPAVGKIIMPVVFGPKGEVLQDSSRIIQTLDARYPDPLISPDEAGGSDGEKETAITAKLKLAAALLELCGDEWLPMAALHYRWNYPGNREFVLNEFGRSALPHFPGFIQRRVAATMASKMRSYLPILGINESTQEALEQNTHRILDLLNRQLKNTPFLLGHAPCNGDFSLYGPIYAHLHRDPSPRNLVANYGNVLGWVQRLKNPPDQNHRRQVGAGETPYIDEISDSLTSLLELIIEQQFPLLQAAHDATVQWIKKNPGENRLPQRIGEVEYEIEGCPAKRYNVTYPLWMLQNLKSVYSALTTGDKRAIKPWLASTCKGYPPAQKLIEKKNTFTLELTRCRLHLAEQPTSAASNQIT